MTGIIPLAQRFIAGKSEHTVSARKLHEFLGVGRDFSSWIKARIQQYGFIENQDYIITRRSPKRGSGNRGASINYFSTLDMAKELAMVERNDKGREARRYFIDCERELRERHARKQPKALPAPPPVFTKLLITLQDGHVIRTEPVEQDAIVTSMGQIRVLLATRGYAVVSRQQFMAAQMHATLDSAANAWNKIAESAGADGLRV